MSGVIRETLEREGGSMRGEEDFFSVARTMPLVAVTILSVCGRQCGKVISGQTFYSEGSYSLVYGVQGIF